MRILDLGMPFGMQGAHIFGGKHTVLETPYKVLDTEDVMLAKLTEVIGKGVDLVMFGGGADIWTGFYNQKPIATYSKMKSPRDMFEHMAFKASRMYNAKMFGICRGAQLLCCLTGGNLIQHVENHRGDHEVKIETGFFHGKITTNSVHHQMMCPSRAHRHQVLAWTEQREEEYIYDTDNETVTPPAINPEAVYFKNNCVGVQWHPEFYSSLNEPAVIKAVQLADAYLDLGLGTI